MTVEQPNAEGTDPFPVGLRVLAVDDDSTCLKYLETLLRRCQYHVTTTSQSIMALKLLRENKNKFDLVISDVHMPDMDGFKLLELVGLEMDLPVIMLSANSDPKLVMKGITHGACDYLVKPVRIEELKNIWQHVVRRKFDPKDRNNSDNQGKPHHGSGEAPGMGNSDQNGKLNKKRKDQNEEEDDDHDDNEHDNDDPSTQKKPRVVWSVELHRKFVAAVNQLGIDKAVPKKILDLMNVEKLTRENVASHLQKYRLYLKRISCVANQQANMVAALGSSDPSYLRMGSINALGSFHNLAGPPQFQNAAFRSLPPSGMLGRLNSPAALGLRSIPSSVPIHLHHHTQNSDNPLSEQNKHNSLMLHGANNGGILQGMPASLELDQLQSNGNNDSAPIFPVSSGFSDTKLLFSRSNNPLLNNNPLMLEGSNQSPVSLVSANSGSSSSHLLDHSRCTDSWSNAVQTSTVTPHSYPMGDCFRQPNLHQSISKGDNLSTVALQMGNSNLSDASKADSQFQSVPSSKNVAPLYRSVSQEWANTNPINADLEPLGPSLDPSNTMFSRNTEYDSFGQSNFIDPLAMKINEVQRSATQTQMISKDGYLMGQQMTHGSYHPSSIGSLEDVVVSSMVKQENENVIFSEDNSFGCSAYSLRKSL